MASNQWTRRCIAVAPLPVPSLGKAPKIICAGLIAMLLDLGTKTTSTTSLVLGASFGIFLFVRRDNFLSTCLSLLLHFVPA